MKKIFIISGLVLAATFFSFHATAQGRNNRGKAKAPAMPARKLLLTGTAMGDSVILRWAPRDPVDWKLANLYGYVLERTTLSADNKVEVRFEKLTATPITPWSKDEFLQRVSKTNKSDKFTAVAGQAVYGASFKPANQGNTPELNEFQSLLKQHQEDAMRYSFALFAADVNAKAAMALGLRYVDKNVVKTKKYIYRLYAIPRPGLLKMDTALFIVSPKNVIPEKRVVFVKAASHNKEVFLDWPKNEVENNFTAFYIERSSDDGKTFVQLNADPFTNINGSPEQLKNTVIAFADTVPALYKKYIYRIRGVNLFAQTSPYSLPVSIMPKDDNAPPPPNLNRSVKINASTYKLTWAENSNVTDIKGYYVARSRKMDSNYVTLNKTILPVTARQYIDSTARPGQSYYYNVTVVDTAGNRSTSLPDYVFTYDTIPPAAPVGLGGGIDTNGVVTLKWNLATEEDIKGYRIYKANSVDHVFTPVSKELIQDTVFRDTVVLKTLTREIFYKVIAVDNNLNNSDYSLACKLLKPDVVRPVSAVFTNYATTDTSIQLSWNASSSEDASKQYLLRKQGTGQWAQLAVFNNKQTAYTDVNLEKQKMYSYRIITEDSSGLKSDSSFPINARTYFIASTKGVESISAKLQPDSASAKIEWVLSSSNNASNIIIYRSVNGAAMVMYQNVVATQNAYIDKNIRPGNTYSYSIKCVYAGNNEGLISDKATVAINR